MKVDRSRSPQEALDATGRKLCVDRDVVKTMPRGKGEEAEVVFFKLDCFVSDEELEKQYTLRGLKPADPYSLAAVNGADPAFADEKPNSTHWKDANGKWCFASFYRWLDTRHVDVRRYGSDWFAYWWLGGRRK